MISFRPAKRSEAKPLIGLYAESGAGKTLSALLLARGFAGPEGNVGMIETESGRGEAYADDPRVPGGYFVLPLRDDFSPRVFGEAIAQAEKEGVEALIIDSASYEWDAIGGVRHMAAMNEEEGKKGMLVWQAPKIEHQRHFVLPLLSTPIPLVILCMRARYPMVESKGKPEKDWSRSESLQPYQSDTILFELFAHGWIDRQHRFHGTKWTREELRTVLRDNEPITLETGQRLAAWARGGPAGPESHALPPDPASPPRDPDIQRVLDHVNQVTAQAALIQPPSGSSGRIVGAVDGQHLSEYFPRPARTPLDDALDQIKNVKTPAQRLALWERIKPTWGSFIGSEQKQLLEANDAARKLVGG